MTIIHKRSAIGRHKLVPVFCDRCGTRSRLRRPQGPTLRALVGGGYFRSFAAELALLERFETLCASFPESRHPLISEHLPLPRRVSPETDHEVDLALEADQELCEFLKKTGFLLSVRIGFVREAVASYKAQLTASRIPCKDCSEGSLWIDDEFFEQLA